MESREMSFECFVGKNDPTVGFRKLASSHVRLHILQPNFGGKVVKRIPDCKEAESHCAHSYFETNKG